jgi:molecular chaperone Hsp33
MNPEDDKKSWWTKCITQNGHFRGVAIQATSLVEEIAARHSLSSEGRSGLGEALIGTLLLVSGVKKGERINLNIRGSGIFRQALVDAYPDGRVRGYLLESEMKEGLGIEAGPWGAGILSVLKTQDTEGEQPYIGNVPLATGHLAKDLTFYCLQSEQIRSAIGIKVEVKGDRVIAASGFLVQAMPGASEELILEMEERVNNAAAFSEEVGGHFDPTQVLSRLFETEPFLILEEKQLQFECRCDRNRVERALLLTGTVELESILMEEGGTHVTCDFCCKEYHFNEQDLKGLISQTKA